MHSIEIESLIPLLREAADMGREFQGNCRVELKPDNTYVTEADRAIEAFLRQRLSTLTPGWSFLGEEEGFSGDANEPTWVIDPIDGTNNFVRDLPLWTISLGAIHDGEVLGGLIAAPMLGEFYWAAKKQGAWLERDGVVKRLQCEDRDSLINEDIIACNTEAERVVDFGDSPPCMRNFGSVAYHLALLSRGSLCAALCRWHKLYDIAGGMALCLEAGCVAMHLGGKPWRPVLNAPREKEPLLIAPPKVMAMLQEQLQVLDAADTAPVSSGSGG